MIQEEYVDKFSGGKLKIEEIATDRPTNQLTIQQNGHKVP